MQVMVDLNPGNCTGEGLWAPDAALQRLFVRPGFPEVQRHPAFGPVPVVIAWGLLRCGDAGRWASPAPERGGTWRP